MALTTSFRAADTIHARRDAMVLAEPPTAAGTVPASHGPVTTTSRTLTAMSPTSDQGIAGLIKDLKQRGLLDKTLILCSGEFGRTPSVEMGQNGSGASQGRDHNQWGFSTWLP